MDYFDSVIICIAIFCSIFVLCTLCCNANKSEDDTPPIHHTDVVVTSARHSPLRRVVSRDSQRSGRSRRGSELERPIGFTEDVVSGPPSAPLQPASPPYPVENLMPMPVTRLRPSTDQPTTPRDDINPPSYEQVMSNEAFYHHPPPSPHSAGQ